MVDTDIRGDLMSQEIFDKIVSTIPMGASRALGKSRMRFCFWPRTFPHL